MTEKHNHSAEALGWAPGEKWAVDPGQECPACHRRVPRPKGNDSPPSTMYSFRIPSDEAEILAETVEAAAVHAGVADKPYARHKLYWLGLGLILQEPAGTFRE